MSSRSDEEAVQHGNGLDYAWNGKRSKMIMILKVVVVMMMVVMMIMMTSYQADNDKDN